MPETGKVEPETVGPANVSVAQEISAGSSPHVRANFNSMEQHPSMRSISTALDIVDRLRGAIFWRLEGKHDIGIIAEDVAEAVRRTIADGESGEVSRPSTTAA